MARAGRKDRGLLSKKDSTGKTVWHVRLYHEGKERRFGSFSTKTAARDFYEKAKQEQQTGRFFPERYQHGGKEAASVVIASYLTTLSTSGKKPSTIAVEKYYGQWWTSRLTGKTLHAVTHALLDQAMENLAAARKTTQTILHYLKFIRHIFRWAIGRGVIEKSPFASVKLPTVRAGKTRFLSIEEEARLCEAVGQPYDSWIRLAILTGMRKSEQFGLRSADIDLDRGLITLSTHQERLCAVHPLDGGSQGDPSRIDCGQYVRVGVPLAEPRHAPGPPQLLCSGVSARTRDGKAPRRDLAHPASYVRLTAGDERPGPQHHRRLTSAQWNGPGGAVCPPLPYPLARGA